MILNRLTSLVINKTKYFLKFALFKLTNPNTKYISNNQFFSYYSKDGIDYFLSGLLFNLFADQPNRIVVDIGCKDPIFQSNSFFLENFFKCKVFGISCSKEFECEWLSKRPKSSYTNIFSENSYLKLICNLKQKITNQNN
jgi:hypothetical protein